MKKIKLEHTPKSQIFYFNAKNAKFSRRKVLIFNFIYSLRLCVLATLRSENTFRSGLKLIICIIFLFQTVVFATDPYSKRMVDAQISRSGTITTWDYPNGLFVESVLKYYNKYGGSSYYTYALNHAKAVVSSSGKIASGYSFTAYTLDNINPGQFLMQIYNTEKSSMYKIALDTLRKQLTKHPRTNNSASGGFWHKGSYPHQMWLDGLYMGTRFYANYEKTFNNGAAYDDIVNQFVLIHSKTYDPTYQLNYHGWSALPTDANSFWANQSAPFLGCSKEFWGRGMGWYAAALVDVLEILPADYSRRQELINILNQVVAGIKRWQDPVTGCWFQLLRYDGTLTSNGTANYIEASASCMFTYALLKAVRLGLISKPDYLPAATKAYQGIISNFVTADAGGALSLNQICKSAGLGPSTNPTRDGTINYYLNGSDAGVQVSNDLKGVGPFVLASVEYEIAQETSTDAPEIHPNQYRITTTSNSFIIHSNSTLITKIEIFNSLGQQKWKFSGNQSTEISIPFIAKKNELYLVKINNEDIFKLLTH